MHAQRLAYYYAVSGASGQQINVVLVLVAAHLSTCARPTNSLRLSQVCDSLCKNLLRFLKDSGQRGARRKCIIVRLVPALDCEAAQLFGCFPPDEEHPQ